MKIKTSELTGDAQIEQKLDEAPQKWYAMDDGDIKYLGVYSDYDEADEAHPLVNWLIDEDQAHDWLDTLKALLEPVDENQNR